MIRGIFCSAERLYALAASYITGATLSVDGGGSAGQILVHQDKKKALQPSRT